MTNHLTWEVLNDYIDDVLAPAERVGAEAHVRECETCAAALTELRATVAEARALPDPKVPLPDDDFCTGPAELTTAGPLLFP